MSPTKQLQPSENEDSEATLKQPDFSTLQNKLESRWYDYVYENYSYLHCHPLRDEIEKEFYEEQLFKLGYSDELIESAMKFFGW